MTFAIVYAFEGKLAEHFAAKADALKAAVTGAMTDTAAAVKADFRAQVRRNFKRTPPAARSSGQNIEKAVTAIAYPDKRGKTAIDPAAIFLAKPQFMPIFTTGGGILAGRKLFPIALPDARRLGLDRSLRSGPGGSRLTKWADIAGAVRLFGKLRLIPAKGGDFILAADLSRTVPGTSKKRGKKKAGLLKLFLLVKSVLEPALFKFDEPVKRAADRFADVVEANYKDPV